MCSNQNSSILPAGSSTPASDISPSAETFNFLYTLSERVLSRGTLCEVRLCRRNSTERVYVAKIVERLTTFASVEAQILQKLDHPNIIKLQGYYHDLEKNYVVLEYLPNGDLANFLSRVNKLPEKTAAEVMQQVLSALSYCHEQGVVHRDIKPENILLDSIGKKGLYCKLADFDNAGLADKAGKGVYGTLYYTAPEVFAGKYDEKADVWSCGVMLYELLTGHHLFVGTNSAEILLKINSGEIVLDNTISSEARDLLEKMLVRDAASRISAKEACQHPFILSHFSLQDNPSSHSFSFNPLSDLDHLYEEFIIENVYTRKQKKILRNEFRGLDKQFIGKIHFCETRTNNDFNLHSERIVNFAEFMHGSISKEVKRDKEVVKEFMKEFDWEGKGTVEKANVQKVLVGPEKKMVLDKFFQYFNTHKTNKMSSEDFYNFIVKNINC